MKKRHLYYLLLLFTAMLAAGCEDRDDTFRIGISQCSNDAWRQQMNREMLREASFNRKKVQLDIRSANNNSALQIKQIDSLMNDDIDLLIVSPNEAKELTPVVEKAFNRGLPIVMVDRKIASNKFTAFIGADNKAIGHDVGSFIVTQLKENGTVAEFTGEMGATAAQDRHEGFANALKGFPGVKLVAQIEAGWEGRNVEMQLDSLFKTGTIPDAVFAHNDRMGVKIYHAAKKLGHNLQVVGIDGLTGENDGLSNVERNELTASFVYPTGGDKVIQKSLHILKKEPYERETKLNSAVINGATARVFRLQSDQIYESEKRLDRLGSQLDRFLSRYSMQNMLLVACIIIIVLTGIVLSVGLRAYFTTISRNEELDQQKRKLEEQRDELVSLSKELQESTRSKLTFFTEVSHDFRTPLTLITAPLEQLQGAKNLTTEQRDLIHIMQTNVDVLMRLVGQTLDINKFEDGRLKLNLQRVDLCTLMQKWCEPFKELARKKMIRYSVVCPRSAGEEVPDTVVFDPEKMESIVYNILSNAFKFTPEGGKINVKLSFHNDSEQGQRLNLLIEDTGKGIAPEKLAHIFDRYYQVDASHEGSGIGLATVKTYVDLHGGTVFAESSPGKGSRFSVTIPSEPTNASITACDRLLTRQNSESENAFSHSENTVNETCVASTPPESTPQTVSITVSNTPKQPKNSDNETCESNTKSTILIIDDNEDIRSYIRILLGSEYLIEEAANGREGLNKARKLIPDAVVCDIMMPIMDGWECCRRIKDEWQTSHIPVMLLTACTLDEQRITGYDCGADAYISKPFSPDMFRSRLRNLIANRRRLKSFFGDKTTLEKSDVSEPDKGFTERFRLLIEENLSNSELSIEDLASDMGLGRSQLYRKVKSLTGYSPVELVRVARLKKAAEILTRTDKNVSEVAYEVGFSTPSYLTKCFREYFGVSPTDYTKTN